MEHILSVMKYAIVLLVLSFISGNALAQQDNWKQLSGPYSGEIVQAEFNALGNMYSITNNGEGFYYNGSLHAWQSMTMPAAFGVLSGVFYHGRILAERSGAVLFYNNSKPYYNQWGDPGIYRSDDYGKTWSLTYRHTDDHPWFDAIYQSASGALYAFKGGNLGGFTTIIYSSSDDGSSWDSLSSIPLISNSFAVDDSDRCYFTVQGTETSIVRYDVKNHLFAAYPSKRLLNNCWISICQGTICVRSDTALFILDKNGNWKCQQTFPSVSWYMSSGLYSAPDGRLITSVGSTNSTCLLISSTLGKSWDTIATAANSMPHHCCFDPNGVIYVTSANSYPNEYRATMIAGIYRYGAGIGHPEAFGVPQLNIHTLQEGPLQSINAVDYYQLGGSLTWQNKVAQYSSLDSGHSWKQTREIFPTMGAEGDSLLALYGIFVHETDGGSYYFGRAQLAKNGSPSFVAYAQPFSFDFHNKTTFINFYSDPLCATWNHNLYSLFRIGGDNGELLLSSDRGNTWDNIPTPITGATLQTFELDDNGTLYIGFSPALYRSTNLGVSWEKIITGLENVQITGIRFIDTSTIVVSTAGKGIWHSFDHGATWSQWGIAQESVRAFEISGSRCYAATEHGLFTCDLNSSQWQKEIYDDSLHLALALLKLSDGRIVVSFSHNGLWTNDASYKSSVIHRQKTVASELLQATASSGMLTVVYSSAEASATTIVLYDLLGREVLVLADQYMSPGETTISFVLPSLPPGTYFVVATAANGRTLCKIRL